MNEITGGDVNNLVLKNQTYTSPAYDFGKTGGEVDFGFINNGFTFNNVIILMDSTPSKLVLKNVKNGQSGVIKVLRAKQINGYADNLKSTTQLPVGDKLNNTEYFTYYVFSSNEILFSRI